MIFRRYLFWAREVGKAVRRFGPVMARGERLPGTRQAGKGVQDDLPQLKNLKGAVGLVAKIAAIAMELTQASPDSTGQSRFHWFIPYPPQIPICVGICVRKLWESVQASP